jgi:hypothetical protein
MMLVMRKISSDWKSGRQGDITSTILAPLLASDVTTLVYTIAPVFILLFFSSVASITFCQQVGKVRLKSWDTVLPMELRTRLNWALTCRRNDASIG